jgi:hypothetical protein
MIYVLRMTQMECAVLATLDTISEELQAEPVSFYLLTVIVALMTLFLEFA